MSRNDPVRHFFLLKVEVLFRTDSEYPKDAGFTGDPRFVYPFPESPCLSLTMPISNSEIGNLIIDRSVLIL